MSLFFELFLWTCKVCVACYIRERSTRLQIQWRAKDIWDSQMYLCNLGCFETACSSQTACSAFFSKKGHVTFSWSYCLQQETTHYLSRQCFWRMSSYLSQYAAPSSVPYILQKTENNTRLHNCCAVKLIFKKRKEKNCWWSWSNLGSF